jgi:hypothetical protein
MLVSAAPVPALPQLPDWPGFFTWLAAASGNIRLEAGVSEPALDRA